MALTLGLNTALSGLLTSQRGLDVVSQNITNVNTPGYTKKTANQQSVALAGEGAGVTIASIGRSVDEGLLASIRAQNTTLGQLNAEQQYLPQIENLFGKVGDQTSIAGTLNSLQTALQGLSSSVTDNSSQFNAVQSALDVTNQLNSTTSTLQSLRVSADQQISNDVAQVNNDLQQIYSLNQKIVRNATIGADVSDLEDQRDNALSDITKYMDVTYFTRSDGSMTIFTKDGKALLDNTPVTLSHNATTATQPWMTLAGGQFDKITLSSDPTSDLTGSISSGEIGALIKMRDNTIPDLQSQMDEMSSQLKDTINQISNRGTTYPQSANSYTGTRTFATQGSITPDLGDAGITLTYANGSGTLTNANYGTLDISYSTTSGQITLTGATAGSLSGLAVGSSITISGSAGGTDDATYKVLSYDAATNTATVAKANPVQTFSLAGGADTAITLFDSSGNQIATTTLNTVMTTDYRGQQGLSATDPQAAAQSVGGPWSVDSFSKHMQAWLQSEGYSNASVGLDANGHMAISLGSTANATLAFRDQTSSLPGATAQDATVKFDADGDGLSDETVQGFSNFFGLNDVFVNNQPNNIIDSGVQTAGFTLPASLPARTLTLSDSSGQLGSTMTIQAGSTLQQMADQINAYTQTNESALLNSTSVNLSSAATIVIHDANGIVESTTVGPGAVTLQQIATALNSGSVTAQVVQDGSQYRLRLTDSRGVPLNVVINGGNVSGSSTTTTLDSVLRMQQTHHVLASVVPDGSGSRLRLVQADGSQLFASGNQDANGNSILSDLGLGAAAANESGQITVRSDIQNNPALLSRGAVQWNANTSQYYLSQGDNTTATQMAQAMNTKIQMATAGQIAGGSYTFADHATASISLVATATANSQSQQSYQQTLQDSLNNQYASTSGVNLDEEVANMISLQRAYTASARVISTLDQMMQTLEDMVH